MTDAVGFVGLGSQGGPMAMRILAAGMPLMVWARRPDATMPYIAEGAAVAASLAELAAACRHIGLCVVDDSDVIEIADQLLPSMAPGAMLAIHATVLPATVIALEAQCHARGLRLIDAPVSGGGAVATRGELTVMCGGTSEAFAQALPVLESFGKLIVLLGGAGAGQQAKILNNALLSAHLGVAWAALRAAQALGIDKASLVPIIAASSGRSYGFELAAGLSAPQDFALGADRLRKDMALLEAILPDVPEVGLLSQTAADFLRAGRSAPA